MVALRAFLTAAALASFLASHDWSAPDRGFLAEASEAGTQPSETSIAEPPSTRFAYTPDAIWGPEAPAIAGLPDLRSNAIYLFDGSTSAGAILGDTRRYSADDAKIAPTGDLVAFRGRMAPPRGRGAEQCVAVLDSAGAQRAYFAGASGFAWSPDGSKLAVVYPRMRRAGSARPRGLSVWDRRTRATRDYSVWPTRAGWAGPDSVLLQFSDRVDVLDAQRGVALPTGRQGTVLSPDGLYSIRPGELGRSTRIAEEETDRAVTKRVFRSLRDRGLTQIRAAFWVRSPGADHLLCISGCDDIYGAEPQCVTEIVDVGTRETLASFPGEAIGPAADERSVTVLRRDRGRLESVDLRPVVRRWVESVTFY